LKPNDVPVAASAPQTVRLYREGDRAEWSAFVQTSPEAGFFHRIEWRDLIEVVFRHR
jgi:hypothetical protein